MRFHVLLAVLLAVFVLPLCGGGCCIDSLYEIITPNPVVQLPHDEAPHCSGNEWWYYTGRVETDDGKGYGIEAVIFHTADLPPFNTNEAWVAHYAVIDETTGKFTYDQGTRLATSNSSSPYSGFHLETPRVKMKGLSGRDHLEASMADGSLAIDLDVVDQRGAILHDGTGYIDYGIDGHSFYYSRPDMEATGTMVIDGKVRNVAGTLWFDRQWGKDLNNPWLKWDWFSVRLDDGTCIMMFMFRDPNIAVARGTYVPAIGKAIALYREDFSITETATWQSPRTRGIYPTQWQIQIPSQGLDFTVTAVAEDQEIDSRWTTLNIYWEGLCTVAGTRGDQPVSGHTYVEMTSRATLRNVANLP